MKAIKYIFTIVCMIATVSSCTDNFEEINTNPNAQVVGSNEGLLLGAQITAGRELVDNIRSYNHGMAKWVQYYYDVIDDNNFVRQNPREDFNDFWVYHNLVTQAIPTVERILDNTETTPHPNYRGAALVMKAWMYQNLTELMGPIPFSDAQQGEVSEDPQFNKPKLDSQEEIMKGVLALLEEANNTFDLSGNAGVAMTAASDAYAGGNVLKWKKFANSLRARVLLRISDTDPATAKAGLEQIFSNPTQYPVLSSNADNIGITWENATGTYFDPLANYVNNNGFAPVVMTGILNILGDRMDPRMKKIAAPAASYTTPTYVGLPPAFDAANPSGFTGMTRNQISALAPSFTAVQFRPIMTYSEVMFIKAEAALKTYNVGTTASAAYVEGITANMQQLGVDSADITTYLANPMVVYNTTNALEQIITQRYIAQFGQSINTYAMIRRTGYPVLDFYEIGIYKNNGYPVRILYPPHFTNYNLENFEAALQGITIIDGVFGSKYWFFENAPDPRMAPTLQTGPVTYSY